MDNTVQYSTVQYSTRQVRSYLRLLAASRVQWLHAIIWCITPEDKVSAVQYSSVQCSAVQYGTVQYSTVQYSTVKHAIVLITGRLLSGIHPVLDETT